MTISLSPETLLTLQGYSDAKNYAAAYDLLRDKAASHGNDDEKNAYLWLLGASDIVQQRGPFAALIFSYNRRQAALRGITLSDAEITEVAKNIAKAVIQNAIDSKAVPSFAAISATKGVSFALFLESPCHVAHALN